MAYCPDKELAARKRSEARIIQLCRAVQEQQPEELQRVFSETLKGVKGNALLAAKLLSVHCAAMNIYIGELNRQIDDLKGK